MTNTKTSKTTLIILALLLSSCDGEPPYTQCDFKAGDVVNFKNGKTSVVKRTWPVDHHSSWAECRVHFVDMKVMMNSEVLVTTKRLNK